jgi:CRISPR-associated protein Cmr3
MAFMFQQSVNKFKYIYYIYPLGMMYGSRGAFLSPENLVGRSGAKFPPEASTLSGLIFGVNKIQKTFTQEELRKNLCVAGPFWSTNDNEKENFYVPIPWTKIISKKGVDEWVFKDGNFVLESHEDGEENSAQKLEPDYQWQRITAWQDSADILKANEVVATNPWKFVSMLHPSLESNQRCVKPKDGLFLENTVQIPEDICIVYLANYPIENGWYRFGGENHLVQVECEEITLTDVLELLNQPIERSFALITPGIWGSTRFSFRYPQHESFPKDNIKMLTDKPVPYRYRAKGQLGRGRYAVPPGSVYVLDTPLNKSWWNWDTDWFPTEGYSLQRVGCGLSLPITIKGVA